MTNDQRLKVALVDLDGQPLPDWVPDELQREQIDLTFRDCKTREELAQSAANADVVWLFGGSRILRDGNLAVAPRCWAILRTGSGTDNVPVDEATRRGIVVANTPAAFSDAVSDHAIALMFAVVRRIAALDRAVRLGLWVPAQAKPLNSFQGRTLGLIGFGHIARQVARKLSGFELKVLAYDPHVGDDAIAAAGVEPVELNALLSASDFVSLHCPLSRQTRHMIGEEQLRSMRRTAVLINTSRGAVVDERALVRALSEGWIAAAGLDVLEDEPPVANHPLLQLDNVVFTPHAAALSSDGVELRWRLSIETVIALARRQWPASCVNPEVCASQELSR
jgi:phosphoglycerate dehydrogenase-like enzyme